MEDVLKLNFIFTLTHRSFELENKKVKEWYEYKRFNLGPVKSL